MGDIDGYDPPLRTFWPSYWNILLHLQSSPKNHDENTTVASWVWHHPSCTSGLEAIWTFFYADVDQTDMIHLSLRSPGYLMRSPTMTWHWPLAPGWFFSVNWAILMLETITPQRQRVIFTITVFSSIHLTSPPSCLAWVQLNPKQPQRLRTSPKGKKFRLRMTFTMTLNPDFTLGLTTQAHTRSLLRFNWFFCCCR